MNSRLFYLCQVTESDGNGRSKVKFLEFPENEQPDLWIQTLTTTYGESDEGLHSKIGVDDVVIVTFIDHPERQMPIIMGKIQSSSERVVTSTDKVIKYNDHTVTFNEDDIVISHSGGNSTITIENDTITIEGSTNVKLGANASTEKVVKGTTFQIGYNAHVHVGNLGYPTATPTVPSPSTDLSDKVLTE